VFSKVKNLLVLLNSITSTTIRTTVGSKLLVELGDRETISKISFDRLSSMAQDWGVEILSVELNNIELPESLQRIMAAEAEALCETKAKLVIAQGEVDSAEKLNAAATTLGAPGLHLRYLQTLSEIASEDKASTIIPLRF
jgi:regulator of protease activity HflC (stomatin/prohibitin superfamily)